MFSEAALSRLVVDVTHAETPQAETIRSTTALVALTFAAAFTCYLDRVGFPIVYTALAHAAQVPRSIQGSVHASFYIGYVATQVPGGALATHYGGEKVLKVVFATWGVLCAITPSDGRQTNLLRVCRFGVGCAMGMVFPALHSVLARAVLPKERNRAVSFMTSGMYFGSALAMVLVPCTMGLGGARFAFATVGCAALTWSWMCSKLTEDRRVTRAATEVEVFSTGKVVTQQRRLPWSALLSSPPVLVIMLNNFTFHYAFFTLMSWMPTFYEQKLGTSFSSYMGLKMLPYLIMAVFSNIGGAIADHLMELPRLSPTSVRKALNGVGFTVATAALWILPNCSNIHSAVLLNSVALGALAVSRAGFAVNHIDIAPRLAGVIMGMSNSCGASAGMIGPWITGLLLDIVPNPWETAFRTPGYLCIVGAIGYGHYGTTEQIFD